MTAIRIMIAAAWALAGTVLSVAAEPVPPPNWPSDRPVAPNSARDPISPLRMGGLQVLLEKTPLADVQAVIGRGTVNRQGDAAESLAWLCYTASNTAPKQRLWLHSGEMHAGLVIDGLTAVTLHEDEQASTGCPELPSEYLPVRLGNGLWLGSSSGAVRRTLGSPRIDGEGWFFEYSGRDGDFDVTGSVAIEVRAGKVRAIYENHITSN